MNGLFFFYEYDLSIIINKYDSIQMRFFYSLIAVKYECAQVVCSLAGSF